ncbi:MAG: hypothetical protein JXR68_13285 [Bacteroidales bacterium]|nr:hypothetical protein [Bacteroidales bacterium]
MKIKLISILILLVPLNLVSCKKHENEHINIFSQLNIDYIRENVYLLVPINGCGGCFHSIKNELENRTLKDLIIIIHRYDSQKQARFLLGNRIESNYKVVYDQEDKFYSSGFTGIYPVLFYNSENRINYREIYPNDYFYDIYINSKQVNNVDF